MGNVCVALSEDQCGVEMTPYGLVMVQSMADGQATAHLWGLLVAALCAEAGEEGGYSRRTVEGDVLCNVMR